MTTSFPTIPGYRIERLLGTGGMAAVWLAVQENLGRPVALKVMANTLCLDDHFRARFLNEARIVAQLRHPNILSIHDSGSTADGQLYMVTDFLDGGTLKERIGSGMSAAKALRIIAALADALMVAHEQRIWHRDVKPDNVLFDRKENFVLADFGIAKSDGEQAANLTGTGNIVGTPRYMSPEQFQCQPVDLRSDIYSLGVMLFEMLTGEVPYADVNTYALALKHIQAPVPNLPVALSRLQPLLSRMLAKAPMDRFPDCAALAAAVQDALDDVCAPSRAALPPPRVVTPARRSRTFLTGMSVFAAVGVIAWLLVSRDAPEPAPPVASTARVDPARAPDGGPDAPTAATPTPIASAASDLAPEQTSAPSTTATGLTDTKALPTTSSAEPPTPPSPARIAAPRARMAVDRAALTALDDRALDATLGSMLRNGDFARWESSLATLPADGPGAYALGRHLALFELLQAAGLSLDSSDPLSRAAGAPAVRVVDTLLGEAPRLDRAGAKGRPSPPARNAVDAYRMVLALDPANTSARIGLDALTEDFRAAARTARERGNLAAAQRLDERARAVDPEAVVAKD